MLRRRNLSLSDMIEYLVAAFLKPTHAVCFVYVSGEQVAAL